jgi:hypothetical protein
MSWPSWIVVLNLLHLSNGGGLEPFHDRHWHSCPENLSTSVRFWQDNGALQCNWLCWLLLDCWTWYIQTVTLAGQLIENDDCWFLAYLSDYFELKQLNWILVLQMKISHMIQQNEYCTDCSRHANGKSDISITVHSTTPALGSNLASAGFAKLKSGASLIHTNYFFMAIIHIQAWITYAYSNIKGQNHQISSTACGINPCGTSLTQCKARCWNPTIQVI